MNGADSLRESLDLTREGVDSIRQDLRHLRESTARLLKGQGVLDEGADPTVDDLDGATGVVNLVIGPCVTDSLPVGRVLLEVSAQSIHQSLDVNGKGLHVSVHAETVAGGSLTITVGVMS